MRSPFVVAGTGALFASHTQASVPVKEPVGLLAQGLLQVALHQFAVLFATTGQDEILHGETGVGLSPGIAHEVVEARSLEGKLQRALVDDKAIDFLLLSRLKAGIEIVIEHVGGVLEHALVKRFFFNYYLTHVTFFIIVFIFIFTFFIFITFIIFIFITFIIFIIH